MTLESTHDPESTHDSHSTRDHWSTCDPGSRCGCYQECHSHVVLCSLGIPLAPAQGHQRLVVAGFWGSPGGLCPPPESSIETSLGTVKTPQARSIGRASQDGTWGPHGDQTEWLDSGHSVVQTNNPQSQGSFPAPPCWGPSPATATVGPHLQASGSLMELSLVHTVSVSPRGKGRQEIGASDSEARPRSWICACCLPAPLWFCKTHLGLLLVL